MLASKKPTPGGGAAAAYVSALSSALLGMVAEFTVGKMYEKNLDLKSIIKKAESSRIRLLELIEEDEVAFKGFNISKPETVINAMKPPFEIMCILSDILDILEEMVDNCTKMIVSDVGISYLFANAGIKASYLNIYINAKLLETSGVQDKKSEDILNKSEEILKKSEKSEIYRKVLVRLGYNV